MELIDRASTVRRIKEYAITELTTKHYDDIDVVDAVIEILHIIETEKEYKNV